MNIFRFAGDMTHLLSVLVLLVLLKIYATKSCSGISLKTQELYALVFLTRHLDLLTDFISVYNSVMKVVFISTSATIVWCMRRHPDGRRSYDKDQDTFRHYLLVTGSLALALVFNDRFTLKEVFWAFSIYLEAMAILPQLVLLQRSRNVDNLTGQYVFFLRPVAVRWTCESYLKLNRLVFVRRCHTYHSEQSGYHSLRGKKDLLFFFLFAGLIVHFISSTGSIATLLRHITVGGSVSRQTSEVRFHLFDLRKHDLVLCLAAWIAGLVQTSLYADFFYYYFTSWKNNSKLQLPA